jgi:hypothetical protein
VKRKLVATIAATALLTGIVHLAHARSERLALRHVALNLPGPPSKIIAHDLDGDGRQDLLVVLAYSLIREQGEYAIEEMVQIARVIPLLLDRRELRAYLADGSGSYSLAGEPLELPASVLHLEAGPPELGVLALTDDGIARLEFEPAAAPSLRFEPLLEDPPILADTGSFYASLELLADLNGDQRRWHRRPAVSHRPGGEDLRHGARQAPGALARHAGLAGGRVPASA